MFDLARQVQVAADNAKNGSARLAGVEPPRYEDNETTIDQLKARLAKTVAYLKTLDRKEIDSSADREITFPLGPTNKGLMKGADYLNHFLLPNVHFHVTAAYAILRHYGVDIGKSDYFGAIPMKTTEEGEAPHAFYRHAVHVPSAPSGHFAGKYNLNCAQCPPTDAPAVFQPHQRLKPARGAKDKL